MNQLEIVRLPGCFIKAKGLGRLHAMNDGTWQGHFLGSYRTVANEEAAINAFALAATAAMMGGVR